MTRKARQAYLFAGVGILQFFFVLTVSMLIYHGGDRFDPTAEGYNFFGSYLSDLGRMHGFSGIPTYGTGIFYAIGLIIMGIGTIIFFSYHHLLLPSTKRWVRTFTRLLGTISGFGYIMIALTPWDMYSDMHMVSVFTAFLSFMVACFLLFFSIRQNENYPNIYANIFLFFGVFIGCYVIFLIAGPSSNYENGRIIQATGQKLLFYSQAISMFFCCLGAYKISTNA